MLNDIDPHGFEHKDMGNFCLMNVGNGEHELKERLVLAVLRHMGTVANLTGRGAIARIKLNVGVGA